MMAVVGYRNGELGEVTGLSGYFGDFVEGYLPEHPDVVAIWCVMDELGEEWDADMEPYWMEEDE